jgi:hypothetical protein
MFNRYIEYGDNSQSLEGEDFNSKPFTVFPFVIRIRNRSSVFPSPCNIVIHL